MEDKVKRPLLLTGLILALVSFAIFVIDCIIALIAVGSIMGEGNLDPVYSATYAIMMFMMILILAFSVLGVVFSAISISRWNLAPEAFDKKKGLITTTFVFSVITAVFGFISVFTAFNVLSLLLTIALILAAVFIMIDRNKNKELLEKAKQNAQNEALNAQPQVASTESPVQPVEQQPKQTENKTE